MSSPISNLFHVEDNETCVAPIQSETEFLRNSGSEATEYWDTKALITTTSIPVLDDGHVQLIDWMPRVVPKGRTPEVAIVQSARVSTGAGIKSPKEDAALINRLYRCRHTSPFESVKFTFRIRAPMFVRTHFIRHRMANINEFSQRYAEIDDDSFYRPSRCPEQWLTDGKLRTQSTINKQASSTGDADDMVDVGCGEMRPRKDEIMGLFQMAENFCDELFGCYHELIKLGVPRELARFCLPNSTYTDFYFTMDLNNLLKFLALRNDPAHAQSETVLFAQAMETLITPLIPTVMATFLRWNRNALVLSEDEVAAVANGSYELKVKSVGLQDEFKKKVQRLHPTGNLPLDDEENDSMDWNGNGPRKVADSQRAKRIRLGLETEAAQPVQTPKIEGSTGTHGSKATQEATAVRSCTVDLSSNVPTVFFGEVETIDGGPGTYPECPTLQRPIPQRPSVWQALHETVAKTIKHTPIPEDPVEAKLRSLGFVKNNKGSWDRVGAGLTSEEPVDVVLRAQGFVENKATGSWDRVTK